MNNAHTCDDVTIKGVSPGQRMFRWSIGEIRHGQLWAISMSLTLIIACVFALSALAERMEQVIVKQGRDALMADLVFSSSTPLPKTLLSQVKSFDIRYTSETQFSSMAFSDKQMQLIQVKAVDSTYPLVGILHLKGRSGIKHRVNPGELWLDERLLSLLEIMSGDSVTIGDADFIVSGTISQEPGLSFNPFRQMPAVYMHQSDIVATGALRPGGRIRSNLYLTGKEETLSHLKNTLDLTPSEHWRDQKSSRRDNDMFEKAEQYLSLTVAIVIIMAAITLILTSQHYVSGRRQTVAMLKSMGASRKWLTCWLLIQVSLLLFSGIIFGGITGVGLEYLLRLPLVDLLPNPLPGYGFKPALIAIVTCLLIGIPALGIPLIGLINTSAVHVFQVTNEPGGRLRYILGLVPLIPLFLVYRNNYSIWMVIAGMLFLLLALALVSIVMIRFLKRMPVSAAMKLAVSRISRSPFISGIQFSALALSLMLLSVIWLVRTDLLNDWQQSIPDNAPNVFAINMAPYEIDAYLQQLDKHHLLRSQAYPIIRGRLSTINGTDAKSMFNSHREIDSLRRELNLTYAESIPERNKIIDGEWSSEYGVSVEQGVVDELGLQIGDRLGFTINSQTVFATVNSVRQVEWREMKPNFYFQFTPDVLKNLPATWLVSFRIEDHHQDVLKALSRKFPTVSLLDVRLMGDKIQELLRQIIWSVTVLAVLGVLAGLLLIFTLLRLGLAQRQDEIRLYRTLGASRDNITRTIWYEYGLMAFVAGIIASAGAEASVASVMSFGFGVSWHSHPWMWLTLPVLAFSTLFAVLNTLIYKLLKSVTG